MPKKLMTRRELLSAAGGVSLLSAVAMPRGKTLSLIARAESLTVVGGADRVVMRGGKTYLIAWAGYGDPLRQGRAGRFRRFQGQRPQCCGRRYQAREVSYSPTRKPP